jgi:endonuclease YncB( thermonuclease family)
MQDIQTDESVRGSDMIKELSSSLVAIVCGAIWLSAIDRVDAKGKEKDWITLDNCQFVPNKANDGDSFHVRANDTEYLVRLYFVDAPETASVGPARLIEQAEYFGVSVPQVIEIGLDAKKFVDAKLSEPFTVITRLAEGLGRSKIQRVYGLVRTRDGDLGEQLVANGLARIHGVHPATPDGLSGQDEIEKLEQLERDARQKKLGAWAISGQPLKWPSATPQPLANTSQPISAAPVPLIASGSPIEVKRLHAQETPELGRIDVNTATEKELRMVPGIGPVMATRIIAARPFRSADDLKKVNGIGDKKYAQIRPYFQ